MISIHTVLATDGRFLMSSPNFFQTNLFSQLMIFAISIIGVLIIGIIVFLSRKNKNKKIGVDTFKTMPKVDSVDRISNGEFTVGEGFENSFEISDPSSLCLKCMDANMLNGYCPLCGFSLSSYQKPMHLLTPGTVLAGKYLVGTAIGEGGFGITYVALDLNLLMKVAIKEYFPSGFVTRDNATNVHSFSGEKAEFFEAGKQKFLNEARTLAKFRTRQGVVSVMDFFMENSTAYIVMEYLTGMTLKEYVNKNGGKMNPNTLFEMLKPLMKTLSEIHNEGIIHRDISPDNIMVNAQGELKLLDFGAARDFANSGQQSLSVVLKHGFAPEEQYRTRGVQGPWTDIYALCATIYRCITGNTPDEANERMRKDTLIPPSGLGISIDTSKETALLKGLNVFQENRQQTVLELYNDIYTVF